MLLVSAHQQQIRSTFLWLYRCGVHHTSGQLSSIRVEPFTIYGICSSARRVVLPKAASVPHLLGSQFRRGHGERLYLCSEYAETRLIGLFTRLSAQYTH